MKRKIVVKNVNPFELLKDKKFSEIINLYFQINHLKQIYRQGWLRDIPQEKVESVADHIFGVAILLIIINCYHKLSINIGKTLSMALIHELGEVYGGDITPFHEQFQIKKALEKAGVEKLFQNSKESESLHNLWEEYEENKTPEARLVRQIDKLEMAFQAHIYSLQHGKNMKAFEESVRGVIQDQVLIDLLNEVWK